MIRLSPQQTSKVKIEDATFTIRPLTGADQVCVSAQRGGERILEIVRRGLVGWEGVNDEDGHNVRFDGEYAGLPSHVLLRISTEIQRITWPSEEDEKKSASVPQSSQVASPINDGSASSK